MIKLKNNCRRSEIGVIPANWRTTSSVRKPWTIYYRFYDDNLKQVKLIQERAGNEYKTANERRSAVKGIMTQIARELDVLAFNPITKFIEEIKPIREQPIDENTPILQALQYVADRKKSVKTTKESIARVLKAVNKAAVELDMHLVAVGKVSRKNIKLLLDQVGMYKGSLWTANNFNAHRAYLQSLFSDLEEWECVTANPVTSIKKQKVIRPKRIVLTLTQRTELYNKLKVDNYRLWRFMILFYSSGARLSEFARLKKEDVDLPGQKISYVVLKGNQPNIERPVKNLDLAMWREIYNLAEPGDFLFSKFFKPGKVAINPKQYTRRWNEYVKTAYGIKADLYSLKHLHVSEITALTNNQIAARLAGHTNTTMVDNIYDVGKHNREFQIIRQAENTFA